MSELKAYLCIEAKTIEHKDVLGYRFTSATKSAPEACVEEVYLKSEADTVIAELEEKLGLCKEGWAESDEVNSHLYAELCIARRALWLMTAEWAEAMGLASCNIAAKFMSRENFEVSDDYRSKTIKKYRHRQVVFYKYADYCRRKA